MACLILWAASTFAKVAVAPITRTVLALLQSRTERVKKKTNTDTHTDARRGGDGLIRSPSEMWGGKKKNQTKSKKSISGWLHRSTSIHERAAIWESAIQLCCERGGVRGAWKTKNSKTRTVRAVVFRGAGQETPLCLWLVWEELKPFQDKTFTDDVREALSVSKFNKKK